MYKDNLHQTIKKSNVCRTFADASELFFSHYTHQNSSNSDGHSVLTLFILYVVGHLLYQQVVVSSVESKQLTINPVCAEALFTSAAVLRQAQDVTPP